MNTESSFDSSGTYYIYEGNSINKGIFLAEEGAIMYTRAIQ